MVGTFNPCADDAKKCLWVTELAEGTAARSEKIERASSQARWLLVDLRENQQKPVPHRDTAFYIVKEKRGK
jgi:hypothetical protein